MMKILVVGGGGREHTLVWKLARDRQCSTIFCAPGNAGTAAHATNLDIQAENLPALLAWARANRPDLTIIGPEAPLCLGLADLFQGAGFRVFGPSKAAARLEGSKVFAKDVMNAAGVPTARSRTFREAREAVEYVGKLACPVVVKADGLAAGKGVTICHDAGEAEAAIKTAMLDNAFGDAGKTVLVEELLEGEEASILALVDGKHLVMLASAQDHKRVFNGDQGPNTGGMGAYSPAPVVSDELWPIIKEQVFERTLSELRKRGIEYKGVLYAGLMINRQGLKVLEFNCRFGDPETQSVLFRMKSDLLPALEACVDGTLTDDLIAWSPEPAVCVVMASGGYPGSYAKGKVVEGLAKADSMKDVAVFHAGTKLAGNKVVTAGGRVFGVTARGSSLAAAVDRAYQAVSGISFEGAHYRTDIAARALRRNQADRL